MKDEVKTEARSIARCLVKHELKCAKIKISLVEAKEVSKAVKWLLRARPDIYKVAEHNLKDRKKAVRRLNKSKQWKKLWRHK
jgi:hypothetical protein